MFIQLLFSDDYSPVLKCKRFWDGRFFVGGLLFVVSGDTPIDPLVTFDRFRLGDQLFTDNSL